MRGYVGGKMRWQRKLPPNTAERQYGFVLRSGYYILKGRGRDICTAVVFAVVVDHQHHLPLEGIVVDKTAGNPG